MIVHGPYPVGEPRVARQARAALGAGWEVDVIAMRRPGEAARETVDGASVVRLPLEHRRGGGVGWVVAEYLGFTTLAAARAGLRRRYDVVQVHAPPAFLIAAGAAPKLLGSKLVLDVHDLSADIFGVRYGDRPGRAFLERSLQLAERAAAAVADAVVTVHDPYRRELVRYGVPASKINVIMNSVDESLLPAATSGPREPDAFRVVYHGTVTPHYGVDLIVRAAASIRDRLPQLRVEIYGEGDAVEPLRSLAAELGVADIVDVDGRALEHAEVLERVAGAAVGIVPNRPTPLNRFALSSKLFEYVALGIPAVVADLPTLRAHFSDEEVAFFAPGDAASLAEALLSVATSSRATGLRERASARYEDYRWPRQARRYVDLLERLERR
jgi:glycosyltransferase involved in cell wall biosynthesis